MQTGCTVPGRVDNLSVRLAVSLTFRSAFEKPNKHQPSSLHHLGKAHLVMADLTTAVSACREAPVQLLGDVTADGWLAATQAAFEASQVKCSRSQSCCSSNNPRPSGPHAWVRHTTTRRYHKLVGFSDCTPRGSGKHNP